MTSLSSIARTGSVMFGHCGSGRHDAESVDTASTNVGFARKPSATAGLGDDSVNLGKDGSSSEDNCSAEQRLSACPIVTGRRHSAIAYQSDDGNFKAGSVVFEATNPHVHKTPGENATGMTLGNIAINATAIEGQMHMPAGAAALNAKVTLGTINAHANAEFTTSNNRNSRHLSASIGAEAMVFETTVGIDLSLTTKYIDRFLRTIYEYSIDPVVDVVSGRDVAIPPSPFFYWDHGISISAKVSGGWGAAQKIGGALNSGDNGYSINAIAKTTPLLIGSTIGGELSVSVR